MYTEEQLCSKLHLAENKLTSLSTNEIINKINTFYIKQGYVLIKIYILTSNKNQLALFIDEGRLGKIKFKKLDEFNLIRVNYYFTMEKDIFNIKKLKKSIKLIKAKMHYKTVSYKLVPIKNYDESIFQLNRQFNIPIIGKTQLPFFDRIGKRYNLELSFSKKSQKNNNNDHSQHTSTVMDRIGYRMRIDYSKGFIPEMLYYDQNLFIKEDSFEAATSIGIMYGIDQQFDEYPKLTFFEIKGKYNFAPIYKKYITPKATGKLYRSHSSRNDLGIESFNYWQQVYMLAPGVTFFRKLKIYTGLGIEIIKFNDCTYDYDSDTIVYINNRTDIYNIFESQIKFDLIPFRFGSPIKKRASATYDYYFPTDPFHTICISGDYDYEFKDGSIFSITPLYTLQWGDVPFHHDTSVNSPAFYGLSGYYTHHIFSSTFEYRISLYQDYMYLGAFFGYTVFEGSGYDIDGQHHAIAIGPTFRFLFLDHYEAYINYAFTVLFPETDKDTTINLALSKKW